MAAMGFSVCAYELADPPGICRKGIRLVLGIFPFGNGKLPFCMGFGLEEPKIKSVQNSG